MVDIGWTYEHQGLVYIWMKIFSSSFDRIELCAAEINLRVNRRLQNDCYTCSSERTSHRDLSPADLFL